jgi:hypothetical protein
MLTKATCKEVFEISWNITCTGECGLAEVKVLGLWVAGSFSRGATFCGDLDMIMNVEILKGCWPSSTMIKKDVLGVFPDVSVYSGTPDKNSSGVQFPEAVLLWSPDKPNWEKALTSIEVSDSAGRFERKYDLLPLRREQFDCSDHECLVELYEKGLIAWEWVPSGSIESPADDQAIEAFLKRYGRYAGKKTLEAMSAAVRYLATKVPPASWDYYYDDPMIIKMGGYHVVVGPIPYAAIGLLDSIAYSAVVVAPYKSRRGPNGLWIIARGPEHPLVRFFSLLVAYAEVSTDHLIKTEILSGHLPKKRVRLYTEKKARQVSKYRLKRFADGELLELFAQFTECIIDGKVCEYGQRHQQGETEGLPILRALFRSCLPGGKFKQPMEVGEMEREYVDRKRKAANLVASA